MMRFASVLLATSVGAFVPTPAPRHKVVLRAGEEPNLATKGAWFAAGLAGKAKAALDGASRVALAPPRRLRLLLRPASRGRRCTARRLHERRLRVDVRARVDPARDRRLARLARPAEAAQLRDAAGDLTTFEGEYDFVVSTGATSAELPLRFRCGADGCERAD